MQRLGEIAVALYRVLRLRMSDPHLSKCTFLSLIVVAATAGPIAAARSAAGNAAWHPWFETMGVVLKRLLGL